MKKTLLIVHILASLLLFPIIAQAEPDQLVIGPAIDHAARWYNLEPEIIMSVLYCESRFNPAAVGDSGSSYGIAQIHLIDHPEVTIDEAYNPVFSIFFLAYQIKNGHGWWWSCYHPELSTSNSQLLYEYEYDTI